MDWFNQRLAQRLKVPEPAACLPGREEPYIPPSSHGVLGSQLCSPFPDGMQVLQLGMGCFWGAERAFWSLPGVYTTAVGYGGGTTPNPTYEEVCSGQTGHTELVLVVFDPEQLSLRKVLQCFWESHDPTQGMRQGNDVGTQYRSFLGAPDTALHGVLQESKEAYQQCLQRVHAEAEVTTEIAMDKTFYYAEDYHQQYLHKNPNGYCGLGGTGVAFESL